MLGSVRMATDEGGAQGAMESLSEGAVVVSQFLFSVVCGGCLVWGDWFWVLTVHLFFRHCLLTKAELSSYIIRI